jgi:hypothetical protein
MDDMLKLRPIDSDTVVKLTKSLAVIGVGDAAELASLLGREHDPAETPIEGNS